MIAGTSFLAGAMLGLRFKVLVLLPAMLLATIVAGIAAIENRLDVWSFALVAITAVASLQVGYVVGAMASAFVGADQRPGLSFASADKTESVIRYGRRDGQDRAERCQSLLARPER